MSSQPLESSAGFSAIGPSANIVFGPPQIGVLFATLYVAPHLLQFGDLPPRYIACSESPAVKHWCGSG
jgi:hypothetical protein